MTLKLFQTKLKCLYRDRQSMFWALLFPLFLAIIYHFAFADIGKADMLKTIDIAAVSTGASNEASIKKTLLEAAYENKNNIFNVMVTDAATAETLLDDNKILGYVIMNEIPKLVVKKPELRSTIAKHVLDSYMQMYGVSAVISANTSGGRIDNIALTEDMINREYYLYERNDATRNLDYSVIYFYALLGMVCIYGGTWGLREGLDISPSLSKKAARIYAAPYSISKLLFVNLSASLTLHMGGVIAVIFFMNKILNIDFGTKLHLVALTSLTGSIVGILLGCMVALVIKGKEKKKDAVLTGLTLVWGFLAGLMIPSVKYLVASKFPFLVYINPVHLITDALYSLYYYTDLERYSRNMVFLLITVIVYSGFIVCSMRRTKNGSI